MTVVAIVPARGGSRGIPDKNVAPLLGRPLLAYTLDVALAARRLDRVVVSSDSETVERIAVAAGVEFVRRPPELATDESPTEDALLHALDVLAADGGADPDFVVTLEPTSPLRSPQLVDACVELARREGADAVVTVARTPELVGRLDDGVFTYLEPGQPRRRQLRTPLYRESSTVYVTRTATLRATRSVLADPLYAVVVPEEEAVDVNTPLDLVIAEAVMRWRRSTDDHS